MCHFLERILVKQPENLCNTVSEFSSYSHGPDLHVDVRPESICTIWLTVPSACIRSRGNPGLVISSQFHRDDNASVLNWVRLCSVSVTAFHAKSSYSTSTTCVLASSEWVSQEDTSFLSVHNTEQLKICWQETSELEGLTRLYQLYLASSVLASFPGLASIPPGFDRLR